MSFVYKRTVVAILWCLVPAMVSAASDIESVAHATSRSSRVAGHTVSKQLAPSDAAATADFVKIPEYSSAIKRRWQSHLTRFGPTIITAMLENEERYKNDYFVFYHAHSSDNRIMAEFLRNLYEFRNKKELRSDFEYLRFWRDGSDFADVNSYLDSFTFTDDHDMSVRKFLVAVNPLLFGNVYNSGECTFNYFRTNTSISNASSVFKSWFAYYGFDQKYIDSLLAIEAKFKGSEGDIIQIFIPKRLVNDCAYLCEPLGFPLKEYIRRRSYFDRVMGLVADSYDRSHDRYVRCANILNIIQNNIGSLAHSQAIQLRLFFAKSGPLLNPGLGAKMFRFTSLSPERLGEYKWQVAEVCQQLFATSGRKLKPLPDRASLFSGGGYYGHLDIEKKLEVAKVLDRLLAPDAIKRHSPSFATRVISFVKSRL